MIGIKDIVTFFGGKRIAAQELIQGAGLDEKELEYFSGTGIDSIYDGGGLSGYDLALRATNRLMDKNDIAGSDIDLIIYIQNRLPAYLMSSSAARLQHDIRAVNAQAFALSDLGCTDMSMALQLARDFLIAHPRAGLVVICYGNAPYTPSRLRWPVTINGDGGIALAITRSADNVVLDVNIRMQGNCWDLFKVDYLRQPYSGYREVCTNPRRYGFELAIESKLRLVELNERLLCRHGLQRSDIRHFLLQNLSLRSYAFYENFLEIRLSDVCRCNLGRYGHLGPADIMLNYLTGLETGSFRKGDHVLLMNNSPVAAWSNILIRV